MRLTRCRLEWKLEDMWIGVFWKTSNALFDEGERPMFTDIWVCLVPCLPIHFTIMHAVAIDMTKET